MFYIKAKQYCRIKWTIMGKVQVGHKVCSTLCKPISSDIKLEQMDRLGNTMKTAGPQKLELCQQLLN